MKLEILKFFKKKNYLPALVIASLSVLLGAFFEFYFAIKIQSVPATPSFDYLLNILPKIQGPWISWFYIIVYVATLCVILAEGIYVQPGKLPQILLILGVSVLVRDFLFFVTVLDAPMGRVTKVAPVLEYDRDLFPSGHAGIPFLGGLFTNIKWLKYALFTISGIMAVLVLVARIHYSLDVFGGYIVFYGIYAFMQKYTAKWFTFT